MSMDRKKYASDLGMSDGEAIIMRTSDLKKAWDRMKTRTAVSDTLSASEKMQLRVASELAEPTRMDRILATGSLPKFDVKDLMKKTNGIQQLVDKCMSVVKLGEATKKSITDKKNDVQQDYDFMDQDDIELILEAIKDDELKLARICEWVSNMILFLEKFAKDRSLTIQKYNTTNQKLFQSLHMKTRKVELLHQTLTIKLTTSLYTSGSRDE